MKSLALGVLVVGALLVSAPAVSAQTSIPDVSVTTTFSGTVKFKFRDFDCSDEELASAVRVRIIHRSDDLSESFDPCDGGSNLTITGTGWRLTSTSATTLTLAVAGHITKNAVARFRYSLSVSGVSIASGRATITTTYSPALRVWQGTDQFVNICIDKGYRLYSKNLRLYCVIPADRYREAKLVRDR